MSCTHKSKTQRLAKSSTDLRHISHLQTPQPLGQTGGGDGQFWSPSTAGPYLVPVSRWIE